MTFYSENQAGPHSAVTYDHSQVSHALLESKREANSKVVGMLRAVLVSAK
jgi:hypothetical protein